MSGKYFPLFAVLLCFALLVLSFGLPQRLPLVDRTITPKASCVVGDKEYDDVVRKLNSRQPKLVLIGNSMLGEGVDEKLLAKLLKIHVAKVWNGGCQSAWWYLVVKNIIPQLKIKPAVIGIFFRDDHLTMPTLRVTGMYKTMIDDLAGDHEELLDRLAYLNDESIFSIWIKMYIPLFNKIDYYKNKIDELIKKYISFILHFTSSYEIDHVVASVFDNKKMIVSLLNARQIEDEKKQDSTRKKMLFHPEKSFLQPIVNLCKEQNISLILIRVKRRRDLEAGKQPQELLNYMAELKAYSQKHSVMFIDYTNNTAIKQKHFGGGDHLNRQSGRKLFTHLLAEDIKRNLLEYRKKN